MTFGHKPQPNMEAVMPDREWTQEEIDDDFFCEGLEDDCDCIDADYDILEGRYVCFNCGNIWYD
jgi:hypothetical protein